MIELTLLSRLKKRLLLMIQLKTPLTLNLVRLRRNNTSKNSYASSALLTSSMSSSYWRRHTRPNWIASKFNSKTMGQSRQLCRKKKNITIMRSHSWSSSIANQRASRRISTRRLKHFSASINRNSKKSRLSNELKSLSSRSLKTNSKLNWRY